MRRTSRPSSEQVSDQIRGFHYDPRRAALGHDYLRRKWLPREGPLFYAFIQVMRSFCYYNYQTGEVRDECFPKVETIARECGVDPATIHRLMQREKTTGAFVSKHAEALRRFIKIQPRWRYDERVGHKVQRSSLYLVALDDPPTPEDDALLAEKEAELAAILTMEQVRAARQAELSSAGGETAPTDSQNASQSALAKCESVMSRKMQDKSVLLSNTFNHYLDRTMGERAAPCYKKNNTATSHPPLLEEDNTGVCQGRESAEATAIPSLPQEPAPRQAPPTPSTVPHSRPREQALAEAHRLVGETLCTWLQTLGGANPAGGVQTMLEALVDGGTPPEHLGALIALGKKRLVQQQELRVIPNPTGYLIGILRRLPLEALSRGWDLAQISQEDEAKHHQALRSRGGAGTEAHAPAAEAAPEEVAQVTPAATSITPAAAREGAHHAPEAPPVPEPADAGEPAQDDPAEAAQRAEREEAGRYARMPIDPQARQIWHSTLEHIRPKISASAYTTWFSRTSGLTFEEDVLIVRVGSSFGRQHLETRFSDLIWNAVSEQRGLETETRFVVLGEPEEEAPR